MKLDLSDSQSKKVIALGAVFDSGAICAKKWHQDRELKGYFNVMASWESSAFSCLVEESFDITFNYIKGLVWCEQERICVYGGSVSLVIRAFNCIRRRDNREWAEMAVWAVKHHGNPYSPFNFRRTRDFWEKAMLRSSEPTTVMQTAREMEKAYQVQKTHTASKQHTKELVDRLHKEAPPASDLIRELMIERLEREAKGDDSF
jgi:hypothetical protein